MNTEQVVEMIDAITEGKHFEAEWVDDVHDSLILRSGGSVLSIEAPSIFSIPDPRTAREIAGALVAWANRKDGSITQSANRIVGDIRWAESKDGS